MLAFAPDFDKIPSKTAPPRENDFREMAMDTLNNLTTNIPDWQKRLEDLGGQIEQRQADLAALSPTEQKQAEARSLRNKGSTESLKPKDDGPAHMGIDFSQSATIVASDVPMGGTDSHVKPLTLVNDASQPTTQPTSPGVVLHQQTREPMLSTQSRARAEARRKQRSSSIISTEGPPPTYRTRSMIIVYYDSYVQGFFDEMVRFVSSSRNMMRKVKMAAKVAQIKRMAEGDGKDDGDGDREDSLPSLRYMSTRRFGAMRSGFGPSSNGDQAPDIYDKLDKALEFVQSTCEHGAHQFLRDADCNVEINKIQQRLKEVLELAEKEAERVEREEPDLAKDTTDMGKIRTRRPISMRRDPLLQKENLIVAKDEEATSTIEAAVPEIARDGGSGFFQAAKSLEVDPVIEADEGIEVDSSPPLILQYRSTRAMRNRAV